MGGHVNWSIESPEREVRVGQNWPEQTWMECIAFQSSIPDSAERVWSPWSLPTLPFQRVWSPGRTGVLRARDSCANLQTKKERLRVGDPA